MKVLKNIIQHFFKAKASNNLLIKSLNNNTDIPLTLPPKYQSVTTYKYLVASKFSKIEPEILAKVVLILTSKEAQLLRADNFGSIPTFDFTKKDSDLQNYCNKNQIICNAMEKMKKIYLRDIFKSDTMVPFFEIECLVPVRIKNYVLNNNYEYIKATFVNMNEFITDHLGLYGVLSMILIILTILFFVFIIFMTYKLRNHPYIKVISPIFCILILIGCILNLIKTMKYVPPYSEMKIKVFLMIGTIGTNLIYIPMFGVTYRIFLIFNNQSLKSSSISNKRLLIGVISIMSISVIYNLIIVLIKRFYYVSIGDVNNPRIPLGRYEDYYPLNQIYQGYLMFIVCIIYYILFKFNHLYLIIYILLICYY